MKIDYEKYRDNKSCHAYHPSVRMRNDFILYHLKKNHFQTLLDVGCGDGYLLSQINKHFPNKELGGVDYSHAVVEKNQSLYPTIHFMNYDLGKPFVSEKKYDIVICSEVIEHIDNWKQVINNLVGLVKKGGYIILTTQAGKRYISDIENGHVKHFTLDELDNAFHHTGCDTVVSYRKGFPFYDMQKYIHSKMIKRATNVQQGELNSIKKLIFSFTYWLFTLTPRTKKLGTQIYTMYQKKY